MLKRIINHQYSTTIISVFLYLLIKVIYSTLRFKTLNNNSEENEILDTDKSLCFFWHQQLAIAPSILRKLKNAHAVASPHKDGRLIGNIIKFLGHGVIWGSTNRNPLAAVKAILILLKKQANIIITPDGPRGPAKQFNSNAHKLAVQKKVPIILFACHADKYIQLRSWDTMMIPLPFTQITYKMMIVNMSDKSAELQPIDLQRQLEKLNKECNIKNNIHADI